MMIYTLNRLFLLLFTSFCFAQQDIVTSGGDTNSAYGSFSYTVGQILVSQQVRSSSIWSKEAITLNHGVQQFFIPKCENNDNIIINAYPNPSNGIVNITLSEWDDIEITLSVYDVLGKNILSQKIFKNKTQLNLTSFSTGIYLLSINNICGAASTFKLIIKN